MGRIRWTRLASRCGLGVLSVVLFALTTRAQVVEFARVQAHDGTTTWNFASGIAFDGERAVVGASGANSGVGAAYVFEGAGRSWIQTSKLVPSGAQQVFLGDALAIDGDVVVAGVRADSEAAFFGGAAYVYRYDGSNWIEEQKLFASDPDVGDSFGAAVAVEGDVLWVGSTSDDEDHNGSGSVYVFRFDGTSWIEEQKIVASDGSPNARFGSSIALQDGVAVVGAPGKSLDVGAGYVFRFDGSAWVEEQELTAAVFGEAALGRACALDGDQVILGAPGDTELGNSAGAAIVYRFDGTSWIEQQKILGSDSVSTERFGTSVAVNGGRLLVGNLPVSASDGVYAYRRVGNEWVATHFVDGPNNGTVDFFGMAIALADGIAWVGASGIENEGAAFVLGPDCREGSVNLANDFVIDVLFVNGSMGGADRRVEVLSSDLLAVEITKPILGGSGRFVLHGNLGEPVLETASLLPFDVGTACFPFLMGAGANPFLIANSLGRTGLVGESSFAGIPITDPDPATTEMLFPGFPIGTVLTLQALILDPGAISAKGASTSNAVVVEMMP